MTYSTLVQTFAATQNLQTNQGKSLVHFFPLLHLTDHNWGAFFSLPKMLPETCDATVGVIPLLPFKSTVVSKQSPEEPPVEHGSPDPCRDLKTTLEL